MASKKTTSKRARPSFFEQTDLALCLATIFATLSLVFVAIVIAKYF